MEHLAISDDKLKERVLDAYQDYLSVLLPKEFPNEETKRIFETIEDTIRTVKGKINRDPGAFKPLLREKRLMLIEVAKRTLDYRIARTLAKLISDLYFKIQRGIIDEYENELNRYD